MMLLRMVLLQEELLVAGQPRTIPDWGADIFSPGCVCIAPNSLEELNGFLKYCLALNR